MKFSFSTVGCPNWTWKEIVSCAKDLGYKGIELRGIGAQIYMPDIKLFSPDRIEETKAQINTAGVEIPCIASDVVIGSDERMDQCSALRNYIALAANMDAANIRVLGDKWVEPDESVDEELVCERMKKIAPMAQGAGVTLLIETNGIFSNTARLKALIEKIDSPAVKVLWDINHPVRNYGETPAQTYENIGKYVRHVHLKDSVKTEKGSAIKMLGYGNLPISECFSLLKSGGYDGYISLEWTKRWNMELEDAGVVFEHFIYKAKKMWETA